MRVATVANALRLMLCEVSGRALAAGGAPKTGAHALWQGEGTHTDAARQGLNGPTGFSNFKIVETESFGLFGKEQIANIWNVPFRPFSLDKIVQLFF